ncbi:hypothetical protein [Halomicrococcus gelatinilyticus]|uniref:hypothetical protein n=1 Tax=Halomicrococcus gelatinilyticus TaxID=1702103 RepID=UPI002E0FEDC4
MIPLVAVPSRTTADDRTEHWMRFVGGFAVVVLGLLLVVVVGQHVPGVRPVARAVYDPLLPAVLFLAPPVVSAASAYRGGSVLASLAVGLTPALLFGLVVAASQALVGAETGDAPLWAVVVVFATVGIAGAVTGYVVGWGTRVFARDESQ